MPFVGFPKAAPRRISPSGMKCVFRFNNAVSQEIFEKQPLHIGLFNPDDGHG